MSDSVKSCFNVEKHSSDGFALGSGNANILPEMQNVILGGVSRSEGALVLAKDFEFFKMRFESVGDDDFKEFEDGGGYAYGVKVSW
jgi:hypothetical protein